MSRRECPWVDRDTPLRFLLLGSGDRPNVPPTADRLRPELARHGELVLEDLRFEQDLSGVEADLAIVLGGDGSILRAAKQMGTNQLPVIGVNLGKLGFLADVSPELLLEVLPDVCAGRCAVVEHLMFHCSVLSEGREQVSTLGLNEAAILGGPPYSIMQVDLFVDGELATSYRSDGLIISTPVGSTAHNLSAGGPILRKNLQAFVISAISPHTLTVRPVVDTAERTYEMQVQEPGEATSVVVDGRTLRRLEPGDRVRVRRAEPKFKLVEIRGHNYYRTLREKLGWGGNLTD